MEENRRKTLVAGAGVSGKNACRLLLAQGAQVLLYDGNEKLEETALREELLSLSDICGLTVEAKQELLDSDVEALIAERQAARKAKNFARADEIRNELQQKGILLEDTREGVKWKRA